METKKQLRNRIKYLEDALESVERRNVIIDSIKLPKCKSLACANCRNAIFYYKNGCSTLLGCGKDSVCDAYAPVNTPPQEKALQLIQEDLLWQ